LQPALWPSHGVGFFFRRARRKLLLEVRCPTMDTFPDRRQLADDLTKLGDNATATLVRRAIAEQNHFSAWKLEAVERIGRASASRTA